MQEELARLTIAFDEVNYASAAAVAAVAASSTVTSRLGASHHYTERIDTAVNTEQIYVDSDAEDIEPSKKVDETSLAKVITIC